MKALILCLLTITAQAQVSTGTQIGGQPASTAEVTTNTTPSSTTVIKPSTETEKPKTETTVGGQVATPQAPTSY